MKQYDAIFNRAERLLGAEFMQRAARCRVIVFGVGGVGSWCAEGLVRSGIGHLTLVDSDCVSVTNINRQRMATVHTVGRPKVEALREQLLDINPEADISIVQQFYSEENASQFGLEQYDYVIDAIDSLA
ncbi:MAG: ThiF family adenylyltransferase, partial [Bacteroidaceae bacterium]|nr:ThiF family adenylyltransferase [Bacteroidaceae bacterium]